MKKTVLLILLTVSSIFAQENVMKTILNDVLIHDVENAMNNAMKLYDNLESKKEHKVLKDDFKILAQSWKRVETFYLAASFNEDVIDTPRYIDVFHNLKENLHEQMQRVVNSKESLDVEMYKNSFKTINALEYILFKGEITARKIDISKIIVNNILNRLDEINEVYLNNANKFLTDKKWANSEVINMLIESSFKLRDWRVGDPAGLSVKYKGKADNSRAEYFLSQTSKQTVQAILELHQKLMFSSSFDYGDELIQRGFKKEVIYIQAKIKESLENLEYLQNDNFESKDLAKLYKSVDELHKAYYISLVNAVGITAKILDADGD